ncbi:S-layer family protein [Leptolyngbya sp. FACHB-321]|uniref:beta strand repeat-containing protein n=1 Tax=Leptolyngbya sp. FACHB-321 TaxID=2692807 RepID=UPI00168A3944|nr:S-layer family protein [Leptolyngbya sp. FACHB-321]MBD2038842.1 S-layer family protein [Leptolyngbya sp. FACHB-321]
MVLVSWLRERQVWQYTTASQVQDTGLPPPLRYQLPRDGVQPLGTGSGARAVNTVLHCRIFPDRRRPFVLARLQRPRYPCRWSATSAAENTMNRAPLHVWVLIGSLLSAWLGTAPLLAQVVPDATLPLGERSQVSGTAAVQIDGGASRGGNLFHSFSQFSILTGGSASFNNATNVQNIFSRVTGGSVSNIDGLIRANGTANLFLLNPNGILFGPNASLNIGGSFVATTANSINFADNFQYSATSPQTTPLLTVSVPVGLQMGANPGRIALQGNGYALSVAVPIFSPVVRGRSTAELRVPIGQTLALIGGDIDIDGGTLTAEQGRIELGSVRGWQVSLSDGFTFSYPGAQSFGNVRLARQTLADASGGGSIQVQGNQVSLVDGSLLLIQNQGNQAGGSINVNAAQSLGVNGTDPQASINSGLTSETVGVGRGADVTVSTQQLAVQSGAGILARSYSAAETGSVTVNASNSVQVSGFSLINPSFFSNISTVAFNSGPGGTVTVSTRRLNVLDGGTVASPTNGTGKGGTVTVNATEAVEIMGGSPLFNPSSVTSAAAIAGDAGAVTINTARLVIKNGGTASSATLSTGNAGNLTVNASESVEVSGTLPGNPFPSSVSSSAPILSEAARQAYKLPERPSGNSGSVTINTPRLSVSDGANVTVSNDGTGSAGTLRVNANLISLDRGGSMTAATVSGVGGNIDLNVRDFVLLRNNSQITTSAGGNGGNIGINAGSIIAVSTENSDIRANSVNARGGNVTVNAFGIFGIQFRPQDTPLSDFTATGANSAQSGTVRLNLDQFDPTSGLVQLPSGLVDSSQLIVQGCPADRGDSFVITGRGGLPPTPDQELDDAAEWQDRSILTVAQQRHESGARKLPLDNSAAASRPRVVPPNSITAPAIIEATGWQQTATGDVLLVANTSGPTVQHRLAPPLTCQGRSSATASPTP